MTKDIAEIRKTDECAAVSENDRIIAEGIADSSRVCIWLVTASLISILVAVFVLPHVRFSIFAFFCLLGFVLATAGMFLGNGAGHERICVTEKFVFIKDLFGKEMYFRIDSVTAAGTSAFGTVHVSSGASKMCCVFVKNSKEIASEIRKLIEEKILED